MRQAAKTYGWNPNYGGIALTWCGCCLIRSRFLRRMDQPRSRFFHTDWTDWDGNTAVDT